MPAIFAYYHHMNPVHCLCFPFVFENPPTFLSATAVLPHQFVHQQFQPIRKIPSFAMSTWPWWLGRVWSETKVIHRKKEKKMMMWRFRQNNQISPSSRPCPAACRGSRRLPAAAATAACRPPTATARAKWPPGCRSLRRWTSVRKVGVCRVSSSQRGFQLNSQLSILFFISFFFFFFRAGTVPIQPHWAQPVVTEPGDSAEDTVSSKFHWNAGKTNTQLHV